MSNKIIRFDKYRTNLHINGDIVMSYFTPVARIIGDELEVFKFFSQTTSMHINFVAMKLKLTIIEPE